LHAWNVNGHIALFPWNWIFFGITKSHCLGFALIAATKSAFHKETAVSSMIVAVHVNKQGTIMSANAKTSFKHLMPQIDRK
jgi:hypothetical protein